MHAMAVSATYPAKASCLLLVQVILSVRANKHASLRLAQGCHKTSKRLQSEIFSAFEHLTGSALQTMIPTFQECMVGSNLPRADS